MLAQLAGNKLSPLAIALKLKRTKAAVKARAKQLQIKMKETGRAETTHRI